MENIRKEDKKWRRGSELLNQVLRWMQLMPLVMGLRILFRFTVFLALGPWRDSNHIIVALGTDLWLVNIDEVGEHLQDTGGEAGDLENASYDVWFTYKGNEGISSSCFLGRIIKTSKVSLA